MAGLGAAGIDSSFLTQQVQDAQNQIQYDSAIRELEKTRALTNLTAEDYARQKTNLDQVLTLQREQSAIARSMSIFSKRAEYGNLKADVLAGNGAEFTAQAIRRETALAQQTLNFTAQIAQLDALKGTIPNEELERMRRQIIEIDRLKTDQIRQQFADLSREIELAGRDATKDSLRDSWLRVRAFLNRSKIHSISSRIRLWDAWLISVSRHYSKGRIQGKTRAAGCWAVF
jgi:hypothetical protein